ncbi:lipase family protein [Streptomyces ipomoeae]|uniref:Triacylglycerol lipase n=2 Tax=Streptomyces ipomoeae TaxID=103232 RepID=L1L482_9ACTN|nr:lipase family protein [Streptomyces ipomoeae]EKX67846.1 triacylglycerol lipase [Streptomyces ipomoeae 91-03]MDX2696275.1 lipase family protein [Streptomyces ipomoeae]MDX2825674.1 lipase family protein [Streptomyces ipomoeae]MDX2844030.1 lipase family protein [Streptomyces ipomoeae]MDX2878293.1 lipase family protein [Streptomyces ipomoeae]
MSIGPSNVVTHFPKLAACMAMTKDHPKPEIAYALATCSGYAYAHTGGRADTRTVATMMARMGLPGNRCYASELSVDSMYLDSTAYLIQSSDGKVVILCYRGSELFDLVDWLSDFDVEPEIYTFRFHGTAVDAGVHSGFLRSARATYDDAVGALKQALRGEPVVEGDHGWEEVDRGRPGRMEALYLTGHSLGGAVATLMAVMLKQDPDPEVREIASMLRAVYTFGQPMIGSPEFVEQCRQMDEFFFDHNVIRYIHRRDVVPRVPPRETGRFQHLGQELVYRPLMDAPADGRSPSEEWTPRTGTTGQANIIEFPVLPFLLDYTARRTPIGRTLISGWNRVAGVIDDLTPAAADRVPLLGPYLGAPFVYSMEDHAPHHYVAKLATPGVTNEFN